MPRQAVALKKYRRGTSPVSNMSDNEHTAAALCQSEVLSVKNPVGEPIPALCQPPEEGSKRPSSVNRQDAGDVLPDHPAGPKSVNEANKLKCEVPSIASNSRSKSGDTEILAGGSADENIDSWVLAGFDGGKVAMQRNLRVVVFQHGARERLDLREERGFPAPRMPGDRCRLNAGTDRSEHHFASPMNSTIQPSVIFAMVEFSGVSPSLMPVNQRSIGRLLSMNPSAR